MTAPEALDIADGDALSCFTAAISQCLRIDGLLYREIVAAQSALTLIGEWDGPAVQPGFAHYHDDLRAGCLPVRRAHAAGFGEATEAIDAQLAQGRGVIVCGDTFNIPWQVKHRKIHTPHWMVLSGRRIGVEVEYRLHDCFIFADFNGQQQAYSGWVSRSMLELAMQAPRGCGPEVLRRERWAFGVEETGDFQAVERGFFWFADEAGAGPAAAVPSVTAQLRRNALAVVEPVDGVDGSGVRRRGAGAALRHLAALVRDHKDDPEIYRLTDDFWVAARTRLLHARWLRQHLGALRPLGLEEAIAGYGRDIVAKWETLPRLLHYNAMSLAAGAKARAIPAQMLEEIAEAELRFHAHVLERIGTDGDAGAAE